MIHVHDQASFDDALSIVKRETANIEQLTGELQKLGRLNAASKEEIRTGLSELNGATTGMVLGPAQLGSTEARFLPFERQGEKLDALSAFSQAITNFRYYADKATLE
jgi:hypothetical protein